MVSYQFSGNNFANGQLNVKRDINLLDLTHNDLYGLVTNVAVLKVYRSFSHHHLVENDLAIAQSFSC